MIVWIPGGALFFLCDNFINFARDFACFTYVLGILVDN